MTPPISLNARRARRMAAAMARVATDGIRLDATLHALQQRDGRDRSGAIEPLRAALAGVRDAADRLSAAFAVLADLEERR